MDEEVLVLLQSELDALLEEARAEAGAAGMKRGHEDGYNIQRGLRAELSAAQSLLAAVQAAAAPCPCKDPEWRESGTSPARHNEGCWAYLNWEGCPAGECHLCHDALPPKPASAMTDDREAREMGEPHLGGNPDDRPQEEV